jgi:ribosomal protein S27AE
MMKMAKRVRLYKAWRGAVENSPYDHFPGEIFDALKKCPSCGQKVFLSVADPKLNSLYGGYFVMCGGCGYDGPLADNLCCAFSSWGIEGADK